jgi:DivIVA domain-containing protein
MANMALTPDEIEKRQFGTSRKGYSPDEVKKFLAEVAAALRETEAAPAFARLGGEVASVLESAHRSAESITAAALADADKARADADA